MSQQGHDFSEEPAEQKERPLRITHKRAKPERHRGSAKKFLNLVRKMTAGRGGSKRGSFGRSHFTKNPNKLAQRVVVKARYVKMNTRGVKALKEHLSYIQRDGVDRDGGTPHAFNQEATVLTREAVNEFANDCANDARNFRFIVAPENGNALDMTAYIREVMSKVEEDLKSKLQWTAVTHYNTDNTHTHIVIRGKDDQGNDLVISPDYISKGFRNRASEIATRHLGLRAEHEIQTTLIKETTQDRMTSLDRDIIRRADEFRCYTIPPVTGDPLKNQTRSAYIKRLQYLEQLGLAEERLNGYWKIREGAEQILKDMGQRNDIIKTLHARMKHTERIPDCYIHRTNDKDITTNTITGTVLTKGIENEITDSKYIVVKGEDGKAHYFPLGAMAERPGFESEPGSIVTIKGKDITPKYDTDKNLIKIAMRGIQNDKGQAIGGKGIYDPADHLKYETLQLTDAQTEPGHIVNQHIARADKLVQQGLANKLPNGSYEIDGDAARHIAALEAKQKVQGPRYSYEVQAFSIAPLHEQITATGPTKLDQMITAQARTQDLSKPERTAIQNETAEAIEKRIEVLKSRGLMWKAKGKNGQPDKYTLAPDAYDKMETAFRAELHTKLQTKYGQAVTLNEGQSFQGTLAEIQRLPEGQYAVIHNKETKTFTVTKLTPAIAKYHGTDQAFTIKANLNRFRTPTAKTLPKGLQK